MRKETLCQDKDSAAGRRGRMPGGSEGNGRGGRGTQPPASQCRETCRAGHGDKSGPGERSGARWYLQNSLLWQPRAGTFSVRAPCNSFEAIYGKAHLGLPGLSCSPGHLSPSQAQEGCPRQVDQASSSHPVFLTSPCLSFSSVKWVTCKPLPHGTGLKSNEILM